MIGYYLNILDWKEVWEEHYRLMAGLVDWLPDDNSSIFRDNKSKPEGAAIPVMYGSPNEYAKLSSGCDHKWSVYKGFSDTFEFCTKCDEKKS